MFNLSQGQSAARTLRAAGCKNLDPGLELNAGPIVEWATAVWSGFPSRSVLRLALDGARKTARARNGRPSWAKATHAAP
eukprot:6754862-Karenia_brevis.AAC.1